MKTRVRVPQMAGVRSSVEVQQGTRGVGRMLRRGLHGSKSWVLELDENGEHRSVWSKLFRAAVVLMPVWIVLSAVTGGPERGGQQTGVFQSLLASAFVLLVGLAVFSARERRLGNEEPWSELPQMEAEGDDGEAETKVNPAPEEPTQVLENVQVGELGSTETGETSTDDSGNSVESAQIEQPVLQQMPQQATFQEAETLVVTGLEDPVQVFPEVMQQATGGSAKQEETDSSFDAIASVATDFYREDAQQATSGQAISLVKEDIAPMQQQSEQVTSGWADLDVSGVTEGDEGLLGDEPTTPLRTPVQVTLQKEVPAKESAQVSVLEKPVQQPLQGVLQVQYATAGPYPADPEPVHEKWWVVAPDVEQETGVEAPAMEPMEATEEGSAPQEETSPAGPLPQYGRYPQVVLAYLASQAPKSVFTAEEKNQARADVLNWLREETTSGHLNRAEASRMLGVDPSTVTRWLSEDQESDPWAQA